jgi:hypothetical protein
MRLGMQPALPKVRSGVARADGLVAASIVILKRRPHAEAIAAPSNPSYQQLRPSLRITDKIAN